LKIINETNELNETVEHKNSEKQPQDSQLIWGFASHLQNKTRRDKLLL